MHYLTYKFWGGNNLVILKIIFLNNFFSNRNKNIFSSLRFSMLNYIFEIRILVFDINQFRTYHESLAGH